MTREIKTRDNTESKEEARRRCREWYQKNKEKKKAYHALHAEERNKAAKAKRKNDPNKFKDAQLRYEYGIGIEEYLSMLSAQGGRCAICESTSTGRKKSNFFCIDHCHSSGKIRKLLCHSCNVIIGLARENRQILLSAISYLDETTNGVL